MNYDELMKAEIKDLKYKPDLLLHSCCAPCSTAVIERLKDYFNLAIFYYNPNIEPNREYEKRKEEQIKLLDILNIPVIESEYENDIFHWVIKGLEESEEGGLRCSKCFELRLDKTALKAKELNFDYFSTTLTISPHKNVDVINEIALKISQHYNVKYLVNDFKKNDGYKRSIELSKKYNLYRQEYCGCMYSLKTSSKENAFQ